MAEHSALQGRVLTLMNNTLPLFPGGTDASKFSNAEVIGLLEWSLPPSWRSKFDLDGNIPTLDTKAKLIESFPILLMISFRRPKRSGGPAFGGDRPCFVTLFLFCRFVVVVVVVVVVVGTAPSRVVLAPPHDNRRQCDSVFRNHVPAR
jgi:hypothetical protein